MIRWSLLMMFLMASVFCLAATKAADKKEKKEEATASADEKEEDEKKFSAKCPVSGEAAKEDQFATYKEKKVYFCCEKCKAGFEADSKKFAVKANHQLVQTKQFEQKKCPLSGGDFVKEQSARVANVKVNFCCGKCKGAVQDAEADKKLEMIFSEKAFKKAFVAVKESEEKKEEKKE